MQSAPTAAGRLDRLFQLEARGSTLQRELSAGLTTFLVMAYIIFVNPSILSFAGIPDLAGRGPEFGQALAATCFVAGLMTLAMGLFANRPFAIAPGMGLNAVVAFQLVVGAGLAWPAAMGVIVLEGLVVTALVLAGMREAVMLAIPSSLKHAIAVGIGFFILFIGLVNGGLVRVPIESAPVVDGQVAGPPATPLALGGLDNWPVLLTLLGLAITLWGHARGWRFAMLIGILSATVLGIGMNAVTGGAALPVGATMPEAILALPDTGFLGLPGLAGIGGALGALGLAGLLLTVFSLVLTDFFDTMGTVIGISEQMGDVAEDGSVEQIRPILLVDSLAAVVGGAVGASSATTYVESAAGVGVGGRTGLTSVVTGLLFLLAMFFSPIAGIVPPQATAPALILVGFLMSSGIRHIDWEDPGLALPALLTMLIMPLTYSVTNGIGAGFIGFAAMRVFQGRGRELHPLMWTVAGAFALYFLLPWLQAML